jgi:hypothetical protein
VDHPAEVLVQAWVAVAARTAIPVLHRLVEIEVRDRPDHQEALEAARWEVAQALEVDR